MKQPWQYPPEWPYNVCTVVIAGEPLPAPSAPSPPSIIVPEGTKAVYDGFLLFAHPCRVVETKADRAARVFGDPIREIER